MDEQTHPATATLIAPEASANGTLTAEQQSIEQLAVRLGLGRAGYRKRRAVRVRPRVHR